MKSITIRIDKDLEKMLEELTKETGINKSDIVRNALINELRIMRFRKLRRKLMPLAEAAGWLTDEDVFSEIS